MTVDIGLGPVVTVSRPHDLGRVTRGRRGHGDIGGGRLGLAVVIQMVQPEGRAQGRGDRQGDDDDGGKIEADHAHSHHTTASAAGITMTRTGWDAVNRCG